MEKVRCLLDFADSIEMRIMNTYFRKELEKKVTYESGENKTQIDFMLVGKRMGMKVKDAKAVPGEVAMLQHRLVVLDVSFREGEIRRAKVAKREEGSDGSGGRPMCSM